MGCNDLVSASEYILMAHACAVFFILVKINSWPVVRRAVNILNKHTIPKIVVNLLATLIFMVVLFCMRVKPTQRKETN